MKIRKGEGIGSDVRNEAVARRRAQEEQKTRAGQTGEQAQRADSSVRISQLAHELSELKDFDPLAPSENFERVKNAVRSGTYEIPPSEEVAKKILFDLG
ncbi:MAG: flagellar biosynthesis anti-sigma factor FlgM [Bdellovibrionales bacterium]|nr:flagellar biosynthesis anti-sigma factor FlgM [Bdellovibrionales bacterium]